jgi:hypothetical protein
MNFIARLIAEIIQVGTFILTAFGGYLIWFTYNEASRGYAAAKAAKESFTAPDILGVNAVLFSLILTGVGLSLFLLSSTLRAILETARNTERLMEIMEARNPDVP